MKKSFSPEPFHKCYVFFCSKYIPHENIFCDDHQLETLNELTKTAQIFGAENHWLLERNPSANQAQITTLWEVFDLGNWKRGELTWLPLTQLTELNNQIKKLGEELSEKSTEYEQFTKLENEVNSQSKKLEKVKKQLSLWRKMIEGKKPKERRWGWW